MTSQQQASSLIKKPYTSYADIELDNINSVLNIKLHRTNHWDNDGILEYLCTQLNKTETRFPATNLTCQFELVTS